MLRWSLTFFVVALIAAVFGFTGIAAGAASVAKFLFFLFVVLFLLYSQTVQEVRWSLTFFAALRPFGFKTPRL